MPTETIAIVVSRHSAFYSPLIATIAGGFLADEGLAGTYAELQPGQTSRELLGSGQADVMQSSVASNWGPREKGIGDLPVHFAQINIRDGFFLTSRQARPSFDWGDLRSASIVADHGGQPLLMLKYAAHVQGVDWSEVDAIDLGDVDSMDSGFRAGQGDLIHQQAPAPHQLQHQGLGHVVASVGASMPAVAFSTVCATPAFVKTDRAKAFTRAFAKARDWARSAAPAEIAQKEASFFPGVAPLALEAAIAAYQSLGCWEGGPEIPRDLYEQTLEVFLHGDAITQRHPYDEVVAPPPI